MFKLSTNVRDYPNLLTKLISAVTSVLTKMARECVATNALTQQVMECDSRTLDMLEQNTDTYICVPSKMAPISHVQHIYHLEYTITTNRHLEANI